MHYRRLIALVFSYLPAVGPAHAASLPEILGKWAEARRTTSSAAFHAAYGPDATLAIADLRVVAQGPYQIRHFFAREATGFPDRRYQYVWSMAAQGYVAVVERFEGTQTQAYNGPPGTGSYSASGRAVGYYRLALLKIGTDGKIASETLAYDEATLIGQLKGDTAKVRAPESRTDFGAIGPHLPKGTAVEAANAQLAREFDIAFGRSDAPGTLAYLSDGSQVTDFTLPADLGKPQFGGLLDQFYGAFAVDGVKHLLVASAGDWVLDVFQWAAVFKPGQKPVRITDFVLLQLSQGKITRSITFKNGAALARQMGLL
jgi:hypothetical protein